MRSIKMYSRIAFEKRKVAKLRSILETIVRASEVKSDRYELDHYTSCCFCKGNNEVYNEINHGVGCFIRVAHDVLEETK